jgi:hypothetical protein
MLAQAADLPPHILPLLWLLLVDLSPLKLLVMPLVSHQMLQQALQS